MAYSKWINNGNRQGGEYNSGNLTIPAGVNTALARLDVAEADFATPDKSITIDVEILPAGESVWRKMITVSWIGGAIPTRPGGSGWYAAASSLSQYAGALVRVHISSSGSFRWGISGDLLAE